MFEVLVARGAGAWPARLRSRLSPAVALSQGLVLVPLTEELEERLGPDDDGPVLGFDRLTARIAAAAAEASHYGPVAYLHQETFGGFGFEASAVWHAGSVVFGPLFTANGEGERVTSDSIVVTDTASNAINGALRSIDVHRGAAYDEYAAIGLDRHRTTSAWLDDSRATRR